LVGIKTYILGSEEQLNVNQLYCILEISGN